MKINLQTNINGASQTVEAEIRGVNVYIETAFGRSVIQLREKSELAAIEPYAETIQAMADAYAALKNPQATEEAGGESSGESESGASNADGEASGNADANGSMETRGAESSETSSNACSKGE